MGIYRKLCKNTILFTVGKIVSKLLAVIMLPIYTGVMSDTEFGIADLITGTANLLIPLVCLGIGDGILRYVAAKGGDKEAYFTNGLVIDLVGSAVFAALYPLWSLIPFFPQYAWLLILYVVLSDFHAVCAQYICATDRTTLFTAQGILNAALVAGLSVLFLFGFQMGVVGYVLAIALADGITALLLVAMGKLYRVFDPRKINKSVMKSMLAFTLPLIPATIAWWVTGVSDRYLVTLFCGEAVNGIYAAAYRIPNMLSYATIVFGDAWKISASEVADDKTKCRETFGAVYRPYLSLISTMGAGLILFCYLACDILLSKTFYTARFYMPVLIIAMVFSALDTQLGSAYYATKRTTASMVTSMIGAVVNILLNLVMIPPELFGVRMLGWGAMGAAIATAASYFVVFVIRAVGMKRFISFDLRIGLTVANTALIVLAAIAMSVEQMPPYLKFGVAFAAFAAVCALNFSSVKPMLLGAIRRLTGKKGKKGGTANETEQ